MARTTNDVVTVLARAAEGTAALIEGVPDDGWSAPTPCADLDVRGLVEHLLAVLEQLGSAARGVAGAAPGSPLQATAGAYRSAAALAVEGWSAAGRLERSYAMPWGPSTGQMLVDFLVVEQVAHGWDLAVATGQDPAYDDELVEAAGRIAHRMVTDALRVPGMFGAAVEISADARPIDRLAAFLGRHPEAVRPDPAGVVRHG